MKLITFYKTMAVSTSLWVIIGLQVSAMGDQKQISKCKVKRRTDTGNFLWDRGIREALSQNRSESHSAMLEIFLAASFCRKLWLHQHQDGLSDCQLQSNSDSVERQRILKILMFNFLFSKSNILIWVCFSQIHHGCVLLSLI